MSDMQSVPWLSSQGEGSKYRAKIQGMVTRDLSDVADRRDRIRTMMESPLSELLTEDEKLDLLEAYLDDGEAEARRNLGMI